jgi:hypothetical protein
MIEFAYGKYVRVLSKPGPHKSCEMHVMVKGKARGEWISACSYSDRYYDQALDRAATEARILAQNFVPESNND